MRESGALLELGETVYDADRKTIVLTPPEGAELPERRRTRDRSPGLADAERPYARAHRAALAVPSRCPTPVTGGAVGEAEGRLDFDSGETAFDRGEIEAQLDALLATDAAVSTRWISDEELAANPGLVKTMKVKPPTGTGRVRLGPRSPGSTSNPAAAPILARLSEVGRNEVTGIEKKGKLNRRVRIRLQEPKTMG